MVGPWIRNWLSDETPPMKLGVLKRDQHQCVHLARESPTRGMHLQGPRHQFQMQSSWFSLSKLGICVECTRMAHPTPRPATEGGWNVVDSCRNVNSPRPACELGTVRRCCKCYYLMLMTHSRCQISVRTALLN